MPPLVIAHRGDSSNALENSLEAFHRALAYPVDMIELDIRKSRDGLLYVMHDRLTGRTADKNIDIERSTAERVSTVRLKNGEPVPTLKDVMKAVSGSAGLNIEIKSRGAGALLAEYLASSEHRGYILVSSFKPEEVRAVQHALPELPVSLIFDDFTPRDIPKYKAQGFRFLSVRKSAVDENLVAACHANRIEVYVWTVDDEDEMRRLTAMGVDGIYTNKPGKLRETLRRNVEGEALNGER